MIDRFEPARTVLFVSVVVWSVWFFRLPQLRHERFQTFGFDLGIYDQGVWLLSQLRDPFVTVRGIDLFGHHMNVFLLAIAPLYRLGGGVEVLLAVQVLAQASGAIAVFLLGRDVLKSRWCGVALAIALLLNPTYQWLMWEFFHPDAVAIGPLLFAYWAARERRWGWFTVAAVIAMSCKEDVALAVVMLGLILAFRVGRARQRLLLGVVAMAAGFLVPIVLDTGATWKFVLAAVCWLVGFWLVLDRRVDWRAGTAIALLALSWFLLATQVLIPRFNGIGRFYDSFFGPELGETPSTIAKNIAQQPSLAFERVTESTRVSWYWKMLAPFALLPLLCFADARDRAAHDHGQRLDALPLHARLPVPLFGARRCGMHGRDGRSDRVAATRQRRTARSTATSPSASSSVPPSSRRSSGARHPSRVATTRSGRLRRARTSRSRNTRSVSYPRTHP